jgi:predicted PurR-regulated permease PerM
MKREERKERLKGLAVWSGGFLVVLLAIYLLQLTFGPFLSSFFDAFKAIAIPAALSMFFAYLIYPIYNGYNKFIKSRNFSATLTIVTFFVLLSGFIFLIGFLLTDQVIIIVDRISANWSVIIERFQDVISILPNDVRLAITDGNGILDFNKTLAYVTSSLSLTDIFMSVFSGTASVLGVVIY